MSASGMREILINDHGIVPSCRPVKVSDSVNVRVRVDPCRADPEEVPFFRVRKYREEGPTMPDGQVVDEGLDGIIVRSGDDYLAEHAGLLLLASGETTFVPDVRGFGAAVSASGPAYMAVDHQMSDSAREAVAKGQAPNTRTAYESCWNRFTAFCTGTGRVPLPATPETLVEYVNSLILAELKPTTIDKHIAAIRSLHRKAGFKDAPDTEKALEALRGYRRDLAGKGVRPREAPALTIDKIRKLSAACDTTRLIGLRDRVMLLLGFGMFARGSEVAGLHLEDTEVDELFIRVFIRSSKTDQDGEGAWVVVPRGQGITDPIAAYLAYTAGLAEQGITTGHILRHIDRWGHVVSEQPLSVDAINERLRIIGAKTDLPDAARLTSHGMRAGGATTAGKNKVAVSTIRKHGRWKEGSVTVLKYIRDDDDLERNALWGAM